MWKLAVLNAFWDPVPVIRLKNKATKDALDHTLNPFFPLRKFNSFSPSGLTEERYRKRRRAGAVVPEDSAGGQAGLARLIARPQATRLRAGGQAEGASR